MLLFGFPSKKLNLTPVNYWKTKAKQNISSFLMFVLDFHFIKASTDDGRFSS